MKTESLPSEIDSSLKELIGTVKECFGSNLINITLFGSGAEAALRQSSDINLLIVLAAFDATQALKVRSTVEKLSSVRKTSIMFLLKSEVHEAAQLFAVKFGDIARRHTTLYGEDISGLFEISRESKRILLKQTLMNYILRTRSVYATAETRGRLQLALSHSAGPLRAAAGTLLELEGQPADSPRAALRILAAQLGDSFVEAVNAMSRARDGEILDESATEKALERLIKLAEQLRARIRE